MYDSHMIKEAPRSSEDELVGKFLMVAFWTFALSCGARVPGETGLWCAALLAGGFGTALFRAWYPTLGNPQTTMLRELAFGLRMPQAVMFTTIILWPMYLITTFFGYTYENEFAEKYDDDLCIDPERRGMFPDTRMEWVRCKVSQVHADATATAENIEVMKQATVRPARMAAASAILGSIVPALAAAQQDDVKTKTSTTLSVEAYRDAKTEQQLWLTVKRGPLTLFNQNRIDLPTGNKISTLNIGGMIPLTTNIGLNLLFGEQYTFAKGWDRNVLFAALAGRSLGGTQFLLANRMSWGAGNGAPFNLGGRQTLQQVPKLPNWLGLMAEESRDRRSKVTSVPVGPTLTRKVRSESSSCMVFPYRDLITGHNDLRVDCAWTGKFLF